MRAITPEQREAAAANAAALRAQSGGGTYGALPTAGGPPDYFGPYPNFANSQLPKLDATGNITPGIGIRKFVSKLPGLGSANQNEIGQYIPVAVKDTVSYSGSDYYIIALVQYSERLHPDLPNTTLREYVQLETPNMTVGSRHIALKYPNNTPITDSHGQVFAYDYPHYLGPLIIAQANVPTRVKFINYLPEHGEWWGPVHPRRYHNNGSRRRT